MTKRTGRVANSLCHAALVRSGWALACLLAGAWLGGCGSSATAREAERGLARVEVARLELETRESPNADQMRSRFRAARDRAEALQEFAVAAEAATIWGQWEYDQGDVRRAEEAFREALRLDKQEHLLRRSETNPTANSSAMAISLLNLSLALQEQGKLSEAVFYAERAFRINRALKFEARVRRDVERLAQLHESMGNDVLAERYRSEWRPRPETLD